MNTNQFMYVLDNKNMANNGNLYSYAYFVYVYLILFSISSTMRPMFAIWGDASLTGASCSTCLVNDPPKFIVPDPSRLV